MSGGWKYYAANRPHPFETLMETEGRCMHCGLSWSNAVNSLHSEPYAEPLPPNSVRDPEPVVWADHSFAARQERVKLLRRLEKDILFLSRYGRSYIDSNTPALSKPPGGEPEKEDQP